MHSARNLQTVSYPNKLPIRRLMLHHVKVCRKFSDPSPHKVISIRLKKKTQQQKSAWGYPTRDFLGSRRLVLERVLELELITTIFTICAGLPVLVIDHERVSPVGSIHCPSMVSRFNKGFMKTRIFHKMHQLHFQYVFFFGDISFGKWLWLAVDKCLAFCHRFALRPQQTERFFLHHSLSQPPSLQPASSYRTEFCTS